MIEHAVCAVPFDDIADPSLQGLDLERIDCLIGVTGRMDHDVGEVRRNTLGGGASEHRPVESEPPVEAVDVDVDRHVGGQRRRQERVADIEQHGDLAALVRRPCHLHGAVCMPQQLTDSHVAGRIHADQQRRASANDGDRNVRASEVASEQCRDHRHKPVCPGTLLEVA